MMAVRAEPNARNLADLFYAPPRKPTFNRKTAFAMTVVAGLYTGLGLYFAVQKITLKPVVYTEHVIRGETFRMPETPKPPEPKVVPDDPPPPPPITPQDTVTTRTPPEPPPTLAQPTTIPVPPATTQTNPPPLAMLVPTPPQNPAPPKPVPSNPGLINNPDWIGKPTAAQSNAAFPSRALRMGVSGRAELLCQVQASGAMSGCEVVAETPTNYGFGAAAIKMAPYFRMNPKTVDGQVIEGAKVRIPVDFKTG